jgi:hypothetical protein
MDADESTRIKTPLKQITVSTTCVIETVEILRNKRNKRERIVRALITTVALVMKAINATAKSLADAEGYFENLYNSSDSRGQEESKNAVTVINEHGQENDNDDEHGVIHSMPSIDNLIAMNRLKSTSNPSNYSALSKCGSPYREQLVSSGSSVACEKGMSSVKNDEDLRMHVWQMLPKISDSTGQLSTEHLAFPSLPHDPSASEGDKVDDTGKAVAASSAALREGMEADRALLNSIQRSIRTLAESGQTSGIADKVKERTAAAVRAEALAIQLHKHVISVRLTQNRRQALLSCALAQLEELKVKTHADVVTPLILSRGTYVMHFMFLLLRDFMILLCVQLRLVVICCIVSCCIMLKYVLVV